MTNLDKAIFFLGRAVKAAERAAETSDEALAKQGLSYDQRKEVYAKAEQAKPEAEGLRYALDLLREAQDHRVVGMRALREYLAHGFGYSPNTPTEQIKDGDRDLFETIDRFIEKSRGV